MQGACDKVCVQLVVGLLRTLGSLEIALTMDITKIAEVPELDVQRGRHRVVEHVRIAPDAYHLVLERREMTFDAGRLVTVHGRDVTEDRSYTIASGEEDEHLSILYRLIPSGVLTPQLVQLAAGDEIELSGPYGQFVVRDTSKRLCFVATGTGVAPCRAYARTYPEVDLTLVHGVRTADDLFFRGEFETHNYVPCLSKEEHTGCFSGRVTDWLRQHPQGSDVHYYLCGAYEMIYDVQALLIKQGVQPEHIYTEGYYYRLET